MGPPYGKSLKNCPMWVFMCCNPQESLENTINTMGTLWGEHSIVPWFTGSSPCFNRLPGLPLKKLPQKTQKGGKGVSPNSQPTTIFQGLCWTLGGLVSFSRKTPLPNCQATKLLDSVFTWLSFVASPSTLMITVDGSGIRLAPVEVGSFLSSLLRRFYTSQVVGWYYLLQLYES